MPSLFSFSGPISVFQIWFTVYLYLAAFLLYAAWASLAMLDLGERTDTTGRMGWTSLVVLVPLVGGACYLLSAATTMRRMPRIAIVVTGLTLWLLPLVIGVWIAGGPLGPKALN